MIRWAIAADRVDLLPHPINLIRWTEEKEGVRFARDVESGEDYLSWRVPGMWSNQPFEPPGKDLGEIGEVYRFPSEIDTDHYFQEELQEE